MKLEEIKESLNTDFDKGLTNEEASKKLEANGKTS